MKIYILVLLLLVSHVYPKVISQMNSMMPSELAKNDDRSRNSKEQELESLILKSILLDDSKSNDEGSLEDEILKKELKKLLLHKRNEKMNQLKKLTVFNG